MEHERAYRASGVAALYAAGRVGVGGVLSYVIAGLGEAASGVLAAGVAVWAGLWLLRAVRWTLRPMYLVEEGELVICGLFGDDRYALERIYAVRGESGGSKLHVTLVPEGDRPDAGRGERFTLGLPIASLEASDAESLRSRLTAESRVETRTFGAAASAYRRKGLAAGIFGAGAASVYLGHATFASALAAVLGPGLSRLVSLASTALAAVLAIAAARALWLAVLRLRHPVYAMQGDELVVHGLLWDRRWSLETFETVEELPGQAALRISMQERRSARGRSNAGPVGIVEPIPGKRPRREQTLSLRPLPEAERGPFAEALRSAVGNPG